MNTTLSETYERDRRVWDSCARTYERQVVQGHPDVTAYEAFEEDFLDRVLQYLMREKESAVRLFDVGCGSARLHLRYGLRVADARSLPPDSAARVRSQRERDSAFAYDALAAERLQFIEGLDFSAEMIAIAEEKLASAGLGNLIGNRLKLVRGSAFELTAMDREPVPMAVSVCNSVGVMQGPTGAVELFKSMRRAVEEPQGIAIISSYRQEAIPTFALGNYESTMDVCGQPRWLEPATYAKPEFKQIPRDYKRAHSTDPSIAVDVVDGDGKLVTVGHVLKRIVKEVDKTVSSGHIQTYTDYESHWYSFKQFDEWIEEHWSGCHAYHLEGKALDALRAEPTQLAILDPARRLEGLMARWLQPTL